MSLSILVIYLVLQFSICLFVARRVKSEDDYLVAGRSLPLAMVSISLFATWFGAETCIGSAGAVYSAGLSGSRADPFGYSLCLILSGLLIAPKLWSKRFTTLADFYRERYGASTEALATWILALSSLIWGAAQLRAFGQVLSAVTDLPVANTLLISCFVIIAYTVLGGMLGDMISDVIQGVIIVLSLVILIWMVASKNPSFGSLLSQQSLERWSFIAPGESWWQRLDRWAVPIFGSLVAQEIAGRLFASRTRSIAVKACYLSAAIYLVAGSMPVVLGLIGPSIFDFKGDSEQYLVQLAKVYLPWFLFPIFAGGLISALLSTIDSILLSIAAMISHNYVIPKFKVTSEIQKVRISRTVVCLAGFVAYTMAVYSEGIYTLLETASSFGTSGILVITLFGLWSKLGSKQVGTLTLMVGVAATPIAEYGFSSESPFLVSIGCALLAFLLASFFLRNQDAFVSKVRHT